MQLGTPLSRRDSLHIMPYRSSLASHALVTCGSERDLFGAPEDPGKTLLQRKS
jgi:hypothetical protein